ncbi:hypothetical protein DVA67_018310 [Solirubrobacter sp. CPCC 204708]|uniref:Outer membrane protein assembly factor BamE n=1 Tax=Solirubrobacter deserti TaxID=2282478 RepID=A0ABT4RUL1_9ACTN|nr:hypothetical protein [Solirubrobacter deserti]MBE2317941.1 hypothetical protein [Solirubrobacter deserti]MDA0142271.1 hypothetical protein [Solirubrobacter deserti]
MRRLSLFALVVFLVAAPDAVAMIQLDRGIAGARLGASRADVRAALGKPAKVAGGRNEFGPWVRYTYDGGLRVFFQGRSNVTSVQTTGLGDRTAKGVGVGSTEADVTANVPGVECETFETIRSCHTGDLAPGKRVTDFLITDGKVARITVGIVID